jgi:chitinase
MKLKLIILLSVVALAFSLNATATETPAVIPHFLHTFYCGFGGDYCGQSKTDDVNPNTTYVILAFANTLPNGKIIVDADNYPKALQTAWKKAGKKVLLSIGGQNGNWAYIFASEESRTNFIESVTEQVKKFGLDGIDLDIESYLAAPRVVANTIIALKESLLTLGKKILVVSPECVAVYQGSPVPSPDQTSGPFNYFVPIINLADSAIDFYQVQAYNNWYDGLAGGSLDYLKDVYLHWRNLKSLCQWCNPLPNFAGVKGSKLMMGILASTEAGGAAYYANPSTIAAFKSWINSTNQTLHGFMMWDSHWDQKNNYAASNAAVAE